MIKKGNNFKPSLLDRLMDETTENVHGSAPDQTWNFNRIMATVGRDIENLLNTRRSITYVPDSLREVTASVFSYGLPDYTSTNPSTLSVQTQLRLEIEKTITRFEPRLKKVSVEVAPPDGLGRNLKFRIMGVLVLERLAEPVTFDTTFDSNRSSYSIKK